MFVERPAKRGADIWIATRPARWDGAGNPIPFGDARRLVSTPERTEMTPFLLGDWPTSGSKLYFVACAEPATCRQTLDLDIFVSDWTPAAFCPSTLDAQRVNGDQVRLTWTNGDITPSSVDIFRNQDLIADDAPADPPEYVDIPETRGLQRYRLQFDVAGKSCVDLTARVDNTPPCDSGSLLIPEGGTNLGITWASATFSGKWLIFLGDERREGRDLDGDGLISQDGNVLLVYDTEARKTRIVGSRVSSCGFSDCWPQLNGDDDILDEVLHLYVMETLESHNTGLAIAFPGRISADGLHLAFAVSEPDQGRDLNEDGDRQDHVLYAARVNVRPPGVPDCDEPRPTFLRGDCNDDGGIDISDAVATLGSLFLGQGSLPAPPERRPLSTISPVDSSLESEDSVFVEWRSLGRRKRIHFLRKPIP